MDENEKRRYWALAYIQYMAWREHPGNIRVQPNDYWEKGATHAADSLLKRLEERWPHG